MIDLKLMFHLLEALPASARLILLGDRDQLASVAAGNVLGDITGHGQALPTAPAMPLDGRSRRCCATTIVSVTIAPSANWRGPGQPGDGATSAAELLRRSDGIAALVSGR